MVIAGALGFLLYKLYQRSISKVSIGTPTMRVHKVDLSGIELRVILPVINESDIPVTVSGFLGQLYYQNSALGVLNLVAPTSLPGFGQKTIEFSLKSGYLGTALEMLNILTNGNPFNFKSINYKNIDWKQFHIKGTLKVGAVPISIESGLLE